MEFGVLLWLKQIVFFDSLKNVTCLSSTKTLFGEAAAKFSAIKLKARA